MTRQREPCVVCDDDTSAGSPLYSDRLTSHDAHGAPQYLCSFCAAKARDRRKQHTMTEEERLKLENGALGFGVFMPGGH